MAYNASGQGSRYGNFSSQQSETREPGSRRKKIAGYLRAANELRQNYFSGDGNRDVHGPEDGPGSFPDAAVVRNGNEEMVLFPSYARRHVKSKAPPHAMTPGREITEEEYWRREWEKQEDLNAIVDVDVRGWIYTPPRGQMTRKHRLLVGVARQVTGIPAPTTNRPGDSNLDSGIPSQDDELIAREAENIVRKGDQEEKYASRGAFSEKPSEGKDVDSIYGGAFNLPPSERSGHRASYASTVSSQDSDSGTSNAVQKRSSWSNPARMTPAELAKANNHLLTRLRPFMANGLANTPISAFFYNDRASRQLTVYTDASGHFTFRAALDFVPTHVRVLASEKLSATEEVIITSPTGVSLISDVDDTVKHSAISAGGREIFRNAFIRELSDLTIEGVREWYNTLHDMGVKFHYVSNSPWQMYPVLTSFFKLAHLPKGSFHLKQYTGMLQGIFEPVAERKKSSLIRIFRDFPDRRFILVGDSGEADLEVYTETAMDHPGRVLGIFIRDVTTPIKTGYFDSNPNPSGGWNYNPHHSRKSSGDSLAMSKRLSRPSDIRNDDADLQAAIAASLEDIEFEARNARKSINPDVFPPAALRTARTKREEGRPNLPPRPPGQSTWPITTSPEEDLIDFSDSGPPRPWLVPPSRNASPPHRANANQRPSPSPPPPPKPAGLRSTPPDPQRSVSPQSADKGLPPPRPRKPSSAVKPTNVSQLQAHHPSPLSQVTRQESTRKIPPPLPGRPRTYKEFAKESLAKALPSPTYGTNRPWTAGGGARSQPTSPLARPMTSAKSFEDFHLPESAMNQPPPPPPPRRNMSSYSLSQSQRRSWHRRSSTWSDDGMPGSPGEAGMSKKEYLWRQRWSRARNLLERNGVTLRSWREGSDVADVCVKLVEQELRRIEREKR